MLYFDWNPDKNEWLRTHRDVTFEEIVFCIMHGGLLDILEHPNENQYPGQRVFIVSVDEHACIVPFVESEGTVFLKTIIPSRKMTKKYLGDKET